MDTDSMSRDGLRVTMHEGGVAVLEMDVPGRRNAMSAPLRTALIGAVEAAAGDAAVAGIVVTGAGGHFCAGGDLGRLAAMAPAELPDMLRSGHRLLRAIATAPKPVVAAIEGHAAGGGAGLALACDLVVMAAGGRIGFPFLGIGLVPDWGLLHSVARRAGPGAARRLMLQPRTVGAAEALALGLADESTGDGAAATRAVALAATVTGGAPNAWARTKQALQRLAPSLDEALQEELRAQGDCFGSEEFVRGVQRFLQRR